jgi:hypothetical protein
VVLDVAIDGCIIPTELFVAKISAFDVILEISCLQCHNPHINSTFSLPESTCKGQCKNKSDEIEANIGDAE